MFCAMAKADKKQKNEEAKTEPEVLPEEKAEEITEVSEVSEEEEQEKTEEEKEALKL